MACADYRHGHAMVVLRIAHQLPIVFSHQIVGKRSIH
jgi:hypothetical protein